MKTLLSIAISASFLSVACGGSDGSGSWSAYVDQTANKYQGCGVLSDGQFGPSNSDAFPDEGPSAVDRCELDCILAASCEEIEDGIDNAIPGFLKLFSGANKGKMLVKIADR